MKRIVRVGALLGALGVTTLTSTAGFSRRSLQDHDIVMGQELLVTAVEVVDSPLAAYPGPWSFGHLMNEAFGKEKAPGVVEEWLRSWAEGEPQGEKPLELKPRMGIEEALVRPWQKADGYDPESSARWRPNFENAPFRLLAIVNRMDLSKPLSTIIGGEAQESSRGFNSWGGGSSLVNADGGEGRLVFGAIGPDGEPLEGGLTVIFEYGVDANSKERFFDWARAWHALGRNKAFDAVYRAELACVTRAFTDRRGERSNRPEEPGVDDCRSLVRRFLSGAEEDSRQLLRVRVNDGVGGELREFREFSIEDEGLKAAPLVGSPREVFFERGTAENRILAKWLRSQGEAKRTVVIARDKLGGTVPNSFELPSTMRVGGKSVPVVALSSPVRGNDPNFHWDGWGLRDAKLRRAFSTQTCCGCHCGDTRTAFFHIAPRRRGEETALSKFMRTDGSRWRPRDPDRGSGFVSAEMEDRVQLFEAVLNPGLRFSEIAKIRGARDGRRH